MGDISDDNRYQESSEDTCSTASCSSLELEEEGGEKEASSSSTMNSFSSSLSSSSMSLSNSDGPLYELSDLMAQLPIKRGLSKFYDGKSQSFTSLASAKSIQDLVKKDYSHCKKKLKTCQSDEGILAENHKSFISPKASIAKKAQGRSLLAATSLGKRSSPSISNGTPPNSVPALKTF